MTRTHSAPVLQDAYFVAPEVSSRDHDRCERDEEEYDADMLHVDAVLRFAGIVVGRRRDTPADRQPEPDVRQDAHKYESPM